MKILVVEDEHRIANAIKKGLEQERYTTDVSYTGTDGFDLASEGTYDCIILDLMLPGMDGLDICRQLREKNIHTPILILTAKGQTEDKIKGLDTGADDYLTKPFSFEELLARVRALARRPKTIIDSILSVGDLTLNTRTYEVKRKNFPVILSSKEFTLLEYLMRHPGQILSKEQIIAHVWDYNADILPNTVEVNIRNIRQKIDFQFKKANPLIRTVRGFGYTIGG